MRPSRSTIFQVAAFSIAMGYLEAAVVVYLREIYYPGGFGFPLKLLGQKDILVELGREMATLVMLVSVGLISGKTKARRFAFFLLAFGIWDICYYLFLWLILRWPPGLLTWDILFLLPVMWVGPVLAPGMLSVTMVACAVVILQKREPAEARFTLPVLACLIAGSLIVIFSFCEGPLRHLPEIMHGTSGYRPDHFRWGLFLLGELIILAGVYQLARSGKRAD